MPPLTTIPVNSDRHMPAAAFAGAARALADSGVVDQLLVWDQLMGFWPPQLWTPENAPLAAIVPDTDSYSDPWAMAAYAAAAAPELSLAVSTDAIRRGPAEILQSMLTLDRMSDRGAVLMMGAGELKQAKPFGRKRSHGLKSLEDQLQMLRKLWDGEAPVEHAGNHWSFDHAWIGNARGRRPRVWALGGGPTLLELATRHADGFSTAMPSGIHTPEQWAQTVQAMKARLAEHGRDPEAFEFDLWIVSLVHERPEVIARSFDNPLIRWMSALFGRMHHGDWAAEGIETPMPPDWHYAMKLLPQQVPDAEVARIVAGVSPAMCDRSWIHGTPADVAEQIRPYVDAGATSVTICDVLPAVLEPDDAQAALGRSIEVCRLLKA